MNKLPKNLIDKISSEYHYKVPYKNAASSIKAVKKVTGMVLEDSLEFILSFVKKIKQKEIFRDVELIRTGHLRDFIYYGMHRRTMQPINRNFT